MNKNLLELMAIQNQLNSWLNIMQEDAHFAAPEFVLEQLWNRLDRVISSFLNLDEGLGSLLESSREELTKDEEP